MPLQGIVDINNQQIDQTLKVFINNNGWRKGLTIKVTNCAYTSPHCGNLCLHHNYLLSPERGVMKDVSSEGVIPQSCH